MRFATIIAAIVHRPVFAPSLVLLLVLAGALVSCAPRTSEISGIVRGSDGAPMTVAHVELDTLSGTAPTVVQVGADGRYQMKTAATGALVLTFSAAGYEPARVVAFLPQRGQRAEVDATLARPKYAADVTKAAVIGDFNEFRNDASAMAMSPLPNGRFSARVPELRGSTLSYQLVNVTEPVEQINSMHPGPPIANPGAANYVRREDGHYAAVSNVVNGSAEVIFDPALLPKSDAASSVTLRSGNDETARFDTFAQTLSRELKSYSRQRIDLKRRGAGEAEVSTFVQQYSWDRFHEPVRALLRSDSSPNLKQAAMTLYLGKLGEVAEMSHAQLDPAITRAVLTDVPVSSPLWSATPDAFPALTWANYHRKIDGYPEYFDRLVASHPDAKLRENILSYDLSVSWFAADRDRTTKVYKRLITDFPNSKSAESARKMVATDRKVVAGKPVPRFRIAALGNPSTIYSNESLLGKTYLIDFWGVWCGPCIAEMPELHKAYETYKSRGFTILSLSCDPSPDKVEEFRRGRWPMPWMNGFLTNCYKNRTDNNLVVDFEVVGFPSGILVGTDGTILETGPTLRGERLNTTLARVFAAGELVTQEQEGGATP